MPVSFLLPAWLRTLAMGIDLFLDNFRWSWDNIYSYYCYTAKPNSEEDKCYHFYKSKTKNLKFSISLNAVVGLIHYFSICELWLFQKACWNFEACHLFFWISTFPVLHSSLKSALFVVSNGFITPSLILVALRVTDLIDVPFPSSMSVEHLYLWMSKNSDFKQLNINLNL